MWKNVGIMRDSKNLKKTVKELLNIQKQLPPPADKSSTEAHFLCETAILVAKAAAGRKKSLGCHYILK
jgi:aspartate oxidase